MTGDTYIKITGLLRNHPGRIRLVKIANNALTGFVFFLYPAFLLTLYLQKNPFLWRATLIPASTFAAVSLFRRILNVPRPYEKFGVQPALEKDSSGKSFPSRHVFSIFVIAVTVFRIYPAAGSLLAVAGVILGLIRVVGGVHEPRDVIAGGLIGIASGVIGYYLI
ncbi:MAG: phosphatase PAP2 family protein [Roseburia sp.]